MPNRGVDHIEEVLSGEYHRAVLLFQHQQPFLDFSLEHFMRQSQPSLVDDNQRRRVVPALNCRVKPLFYLPEQKQENRHDEFRVHLIDVIQFKTREPPIPTVVRISVEQ
jgi:hypothetical protein